MSLSTGQRPPPQTRRLRKTVPENRWRSLTIAIADFCNKICQKQTLQDNRTMSANELSAQPVDATQALNLSAGVSNCKVSRGRSLS